MTINNRTDVLLVALLCLGAFSQLAAAADVVTITASGHVTALPQQTDNSICFANGFTVPSGVGIGTPFVIQLSYEPQTYTKPISDVVGTLSGTIGNYSFVSGPTDHVVIQNTPPAYIIGIRGGALGLGAGLLLVEGSVPLDLSRVPPTVPSVSALRQALAHLWYAQRVPIPGTGLAYCAQPLGDGAIESLVVSGTCDAYRLTSLETLSATYGSRDETLQLEDINLTYKDDDPVRYAKLAEFGYTTSKVNLSLRLKVSLYEAWASALGVATDRESGYRTAAYQMHFAEMKTKVEAIDKLTTEEREACAPVRADILKHATRDHHIRLNNGVPFVNVSVSTAAHVQRAAMDLSGFGLLSSAAVAGHAFLFGLSRPYPIADPVHFEERSLNGTTLMTAKVESPIDVLLTGPDGRRIGIAPDTQVYVNDYGQDGEYFPGEPARYSVRVTPGAQYVTGRGTGNGPYRITISLATEHGEERPLQIIEGTIASGQTLGPISVTVGPTAQLPGDWKAQYGLASSEVGLSAPAADPDGDGLSNEQELAASTHPRGFFTRYFAEGATRSGFSTRLALMNPGDQAASVLVTFQPASGDPVSQDVTLPGRTRTTIDPSLLPTLKSAEFATVVESDVQVVADRTMWWSGAMPLGAHAETATLSPATTWYLSEGSTLGRFNLFYLLLNPNAVAANVRVRFLRPIGGALEKTYTLAPKSRFNIWVNEEDFAGMGKALSQSDVSAVFDSLNGQPIIVERAMYWDRQGQQFVAGHESAGVTAPSIDWFFAEGATGTYFDLFVLVANPSAEVAEVEAMYLLPNGTTLTKTHWVPANSRYNIWVDLEDPLLADTAVSTTIRVRNGVPVIAERSMWWPGSSSQWREAHNSPGATTTGTRWALAEGEVDAARNMETYILIANTSPVPADVKVTLLFEDGTNAEQTYRAIAANSRFNVAVGSFFSQAAGKKFGAIVESLGATPAQIVVERSMYWDAGGQRWAAGTNALATKLR